MSLWMIVLSPLLAAVVCGVLALTRRGEKAVPYITSIATLLSLAVAIAAGPAGQVGVDWLNIGSALHIPIGVTLDHLAWLMVLIVCIVSTLVQIYSIGYMKGENGYARYFAYLALFTASMLGLVVADNLFQLYVCWELVGICSYLLIGFWWFKPSAASAAKKAFVVTRFGDVGFLLGVLLLVSLAGSFQFAAVRDAVHAVATGARTNVPLVAPATLLWLGPLLLFCGAVGKSAQFPLHVWLPDAMEGPTPVSALIHAATMVAAGVYMVARLLPLFEASAIALDVVLVIGAVTALMAATIALVQNDIKKVMAYSTISQLGYMMVALGAGGPLGRAAGMFHLTTHAFFKALLFLTAGSVIHALHHSEEPNDLRRMGGLLKRMPHTAWTCAIGVLALAGFPFLSGFWSKDAVIGAAVSRAGWLGAATEGGPHAGIAAFGAVIGMIVAGLTAFYATRMWFLAFWGKARSTHAAEAHESPWVMWLPLWALAIPSLALGGLLELRGFAPWVTGSEAAEQGTSVPLAIVASLIVLAGLALAGWLYARPETATDPVERLPAPVYRSLVNLWYLDAFWGAVAGTAGLALGRAVAWFDRNVVDGAMNGIAWVCGQTGGALRRLTNGEAQWYTAVTFAGILLLAVLLVAWQSAGAAGGAAALVRAVVARR